MTVSPHHSNSAGAFAPAAGPVAVGRFVAPIAGKTLSRGGTVIAGLLSQWPAIAGPSLAAYTMPAKMTKGAPEPAFTGKAGPSLLVLKVDPVKALEVQYAIPQLIERINQTLGYKAVAGLRLVQAPVQGRPKPPAAVKIGKPESPNRLGSALARMAAGIQARGGRSPSPK